MGEVKFRDGPRGVPEHVESMLTGIPTYKLTYSEAMAAANRKYQHELIDRAIAQARTEHFKRPTE